MFIPNVSGIEKVNTAVSCSVNCAASIVNSPFTSDAVMTED